MTAEELTSGAPVMALSFNEPYGSLMLPPFYKVETRNRNTNVRGWVLICTCKKRYDQSVIRAISGKEQCDRIFSKFPINQLGAAIGIGKLENCYIMRPGEQDENATFVKYRYGLFCWRFTDVFPIIPVPWTGKQGWKKVEQNYLKTLIIDHNSIAL